MMCNDTACVKSKRLQAGGRVLWMLAALLLLASGALRAQPVDTVIVRLTDTVQTYSRYRHWQDAVYRWTVDGGGKIGQFGGKNKVEIDARHALTDFDFGGVINTPKIPIEDNGGVYALFCVLQPSVCNTFFATNAVEKNGSPGEYALDNFMLDRNASLLKRFRFIPDNDSYNEQHVYVRTVTGSDMFASYMFIDRYGETGYEAYYADNSEDNQPTTLRVVAERKSPELILTAIHDSTIVLNDEDRSAVLRRQEIVVGALSLQDVIGGASLITQQIFRNRGLDQLRIDEIQLSGDVTDFNVIPTDEAGATPALPLSLSRYLEFDDLLRLEVRFMPQSVGDKQLVIRLYCNDTTQNADGQRRYFELVVRGTGTDARLSIVDTIDFGTLPVTNGPEIRQLKITSVGGSAASFDYTPPSVPFGLAEAGGTKLPDPVSDLASGGEILVDVSFDPTAPGDYLDSVIISGGNIQRYVVYLKGRGELASVVLAADTMDLTQDTVYFGVTRENVPLFKPFYVRNTGNVQLYILSEIVPHYSVTDAYDPGTYPQLANDKIEFEPEFAFPNSYANPGNIDTIGDRWQPFTMKFESLPKSQNRIGQIEAKLILGISIPRTFNGRDTFDIIAVDTFLLVARKLQSRPEAIDRIEFDSVYVGNPCPDSRVNWNITNRVEQAVNLTGQRAEIIHSNNGLAFDLDGITYTKTLVQNETAGSVVEYAPTHRGPDTVRYYVRYTSGAESDSIDVLLTGVGVQQELRLDSAAQDLPSERFTLKGDTIDLGNIRVGTDVSVNAFFSNKGNLPFRMRPNAQVLVEAQFPNGGFSFSRITSRFPDATIQIGSTATTTINVEPRLAGFHLVRCEIASDIGTPERGIKCVPAEAAARIFFIRFNAVQPVVQTDKSELDFGSVITARECVRSKELELQVSNAGNSDLNVQLPLMQIGNHFQVVNSTSINIPASSSAIVRVRFTTPPTAGIYLDTLVLRTDAGTGQSDLTLRIPVRAEAVPPQSVTLSLPAVKSRPGRRIAVPITIGKPELLTSISLFRTTLLYNPTMLVYSGAYSVAGTAAEKASGGDVRITPGAGLLDVEIQLPAFTYFEAKETIIVLYFDTYLGDDALTLINFRSSDFGDGACLGLLRPDQQGGAFALDSVCNLSSLIGPAATGMFRIEQNTPNPAGADATVEYEVAFATDVKIYVFNTRGERVAAIVDGWHFPGTYKMPVPVHSLPPGLYFYEMTAGIFRQTRKMYIAK